MHDPYEAQHGDNEGNDANAKENEGRNDEPNAGIIV